ncbi:MAG: hypothetical protein AB3N13_00220, partial [Arenibacterium sp.]
MPDDSRPQYLLDWEVRLFSLPIKNQGNFAMPKRNQSSDVLTTAVYRALADREYSGTSGDYLEVPDSPVLSSKNASISLGFSLDRLPGEYALISKDGKGNGAGEFTLWLKDGTIVVTQE